MERAVRIPLVALTLMMMCFGCAGQAPQPESEAQPSVRIEEGRFLVHYHRHGGDYDGWTLWTWDDKTDQDSRELESTGRDDYGLIFVVDRSLYGAGLQIGILPKFGNWENKDAPDRIWTRELGSEVWILSGHPKLFGEKPDVAPAAAGAATLTVHYHRPAEDYRGWTLWCWDEKTDEDSGELRPVDSDDYGLVFKVTRARYGDGTQVGLLPKYGNWDSKDPPDRTWFPFMGDEVWILGGKEDLFTEMPDISPWIQKGLIDQADKVTAALSRPMPVEDIGPSVFGIRDHRGRKREIASARAVRPVGGKVLNVELSLHEPLDLTEPIGEFSITAKGYKPGNLVLGAILDSEAYVSDVPLGAIYSPEKTVFRVFAPTAASVTLLVYDAPRGGTARETAMRPAGKGVWEARIDDDLRGRYYMLKADGSDPRFRPDRELIDPYSRCNTAHDGRGMIIDDHTPVADRPDFPIEEAVIYELHVRDFTIDPESGIQNRGKFLAFTETGTTLLGHSDIKTGVDHLVELGVNAVQIMPVQDFDNDESDEQYNWGYMPVHFNSPDGWYATRMDDATRVVEFKELVDALHRRGIRVIMDVVYNHTAETSPARVFSFNGLAPGYYYRLREDGSFWNGSGTGNETRSEAPMMRRFIIESCRYWVTEYKVDGFRFDLMGLHDLKTMTQLVNELRAIDPNLLIHGEPWSGGDTPIRKTEKGSQRGKRFAVFNDHFRDAVKGGVFDQNPAFVQVGSHIDRIKAGIRGAVTDFADNPLEAIGYVACHDNHTFWDRLFLTTRNRPDVTDEDRKRMDRMGAVLVLTSQGIPFLHSGQEMLRTKGGNENSYNVPDSVNMIRWRWKMENRDIFEYYKGLIALRKAHPMFRMTSRRAVMGNLKFLDDDLGFPVPPRCVGYHLNGKNAGDEWDEGVVLYNADTRSAEFRIPPGGQWTIVVDEDEAGVAPVETGPSTVSGLTVSVPGRSAMVLYR
ncbi:MAG: type I pullulanase [Candidatus Eisenbacteria sp.]|nr:type I pullulanase [Candidatus Eisenbacteria bacterium]